MGCDEIDEKDSMKWSGGNKMQGLAGKYPDGSPRPTQNQKNHHPTVKSIALMEYLCTLTKTPTGGLVLDPFAGSGTTLMAAKKIGRDFIGIEKEKEYCEIAEARIRAIPRPLF
jgi:site-specific DNA-methyltransferase (adenine-specific)